METTVGAFEARRQFGRILERVVVRGDKVIVERHGEPVAALVPIEVYNQWKRERSLFFAKLREVQARANLPAEEADRLVKEAIETVRAAGR
ncbi:MAG: type II toxin-antitoxin system Phd/YefM family antitoxin [Chloroflexota bacterium]